MCFFIHELLEQLGFKFFPSAKRQNQPLCLWINYYCWRPVWLHKAHFLIQHFHSFRKAIRTVPQRCISDFFATMLSYSLRPYQLDVFLHLAESLWVCVFMSVCVWLRSPSEGDVLTAEVSTTGRSCLLSHHSGFFILSSFLLFFLLFPLSLPFSILHLPFCSAYCHIFLFFSSIHMFTVLFT